jgi:hypothetical protein
MPSADNAILYYEAGQTLVPMVALTDSGDHLKYNSAAELWSDRSGYNPDVKPNGVLTGLAVSPAAAGTDDLVDVSGGTLNLNGVVTTVTAGPNKVCLRGAAANICRINSITITSLGAIAVVSGTAHTAFSEERGASGGPPVIDVDAVEIAQVRFGSISAAPVLASEVKSIPNTHREMANFPTYENEYVRVVNGIMGVAGITFSSAPMLNHTGGAAKKVFALYYTPALATVPKSSDFKRPANSKSVSSTQIYGGAIGAVSSALGQGGFKAYLNDGVTDGLLSEEGMKLWFKFKPDRLKAPYILSQGYLGIVEQYPAGAAIMAECTISAEVAGNRVAS